MLFSISNLKLVSSVLCLTILACATTGWAQLLQQDEKPDPIPRNVALEYPIGKLEEMSLEQLKAELDKFLPEFRQSLKTMWAAKTRYQHASKSESFGYGKTWRENATAGQAIHQRIKEISMEIFLKEESPTEEQSALAFRMAIGSGEEGRIGIANRVMKKMMKLYPDDQPIWMNAARVAVFTNDFEIADRLIQTKPEVIKDLPKEEIALFASLPKISKQFETEKLIRQAEAKADDLPRVELTTSKGKIVIELFENEAPSTVGNFIHLVESGFYEQAFFHQVIRNFRAQVGLYFKDRRPPTDYEIVNESNADNARNIFRGTIATIPKGNTIGAAEFSIYTAPNPFASDDYEETVFGRVISGMDVVDILKVNCRFSKKSAISERINSKQNDMPDDYIVSAKVLRKRPNVDYHPKKLPPSKK